MSSSLQPVCCCLLQGCAERGWFSMQDVLCIWGWRLEVEKDLHIAVSSVPYIFGHALPSASLTAFLDAFGAGSCASAQQSAPLAVQTLLQSIACHSAIMFGQSLTSAETAGLIASLAGTRLPFHCAHGRPTTALLGDLDTWSRRGPSRRGIGGLAGKSAGIRVLDVSVAMKCVRKALGHVASKPQHFNT
jgi:DNA mismatch repair ATPase MutL